MQKRVILVVLMFVVGTGLAIVTLHPSDNAKAQSSRLISGTIMPLYIYPTNPSWSTVATIKDAHPKVPIVVIANPNSGPGNSPDSNFVNGINKLRAHGVVVIGYVATGYGSKSLAYLGGQINKYRSWYNVNGILFDEMSNVAGNENYYRTLSNYAKSLGLSYTVGNPGTDVPATYVGTVDTILIYENRGYPSLGYLDGWHSHYNKSNWGMTSFGDPYLSQLWIAYAKQYVGYIFITNDVLPNPYDSLPSYFSTLVSDLD
ncbi:MAG: spherulation-specific family 4 protein [Thermoproteota archaeon]|nr:spherulation-specific family 4 protein [Thermoproteota archaeon]